MPQERPREQQAITNEHTAKWRIYTDRARDSSAQGNHGEAERFLLKALEEARAGFGERDLHVPAAMQNLAELYRITRKPQLAEPLYKDVSARGPSRRTDRPLGLSRPDQARNAQPQAIRLLEEMSGARHPSEIPAPASPRSPFPLTARMTAALPFALLQVLHPPCTTWPASTSPSGAWPRRKSATRGPSTSGRTSLARSESI